jgi:hypothetical protein
MRRAVCRSPTHSMGLHWSRALWKSNRGMRTCRLFAARAHSVDGHRRSG